MEDSVEFKTVRKCMVELEASLKELDRDMVDSLYNNLFITKDVHDQVLSAKNLSKSEKAHELVKGIKNRVEQDKNSYFVLVGCLIKVGAMYQTIINTLAVEYHRQLKLVAQENGTRQTSEYVCVCMYLHTCADLAVCVHVPEWAPGFHEWVEQDLDFLISNLNHACSDVCMFTLLLCVSVRV